MIRPRFSLRTIFLVVAAVAVASWAYWIGWPWWTIYREQCQFEANCRALHVGQTDKEMFGFSTPLFNGFGHHGSYSVDDLEGRRVGWCLYEEWADRWYLICTTYSDHSDRNIGLKVFSLSPARHDYQVQTVLARQEMSRLANHDSLHDPEKVAYCNNFICFIMGDRKTNPGFKYELIYADPPAAK